MEGVRHEAESPLLACMVNIKRQCKTTKVRSTLEVSPGELCQWEITAQNTMNGYSYKLRGESIVQLLKVRTKQAELNSQSLLGSESEFYAPPIPRPPPLQLTFTFLCLLEGKDPGPPPGTVCDIP